MTTANQFASMSSTASRVIERVGTCADGDNCPRYHCRACGHYWLGNVEHICGFAAPLRGSASSREQLEETILRWMELELARDDDPTRCAQNVLERVKAAALSEAFLDVYGGEMIGELWERHQDAHRSPEKGNGHAEIIPP